MMTELLLQSTHKLVSSHRQSTVKKANEMKARSGAYMEENIPQMCQKQAPKKLRFMDELRKGSKQALLLLTRVFQYVCPHKISPREEWNETQKHHVNKSIKFVTAVNVYSM